jgi:hypothetical protein
MELKSLTQQSKCVEAESRCLKMFREFLVYCSMRLGVPSIAPRLLGAVGDQLGRQILPSVEWCTTGQLQYMFGARFPSISDAVDRWSSGPVGAPDTVRCDHPTVGSAMCRPLTPRRRPLVAGAYDSPHSPVHHRTVR